MSILIWSIAIFVFIVIIIILLGLSVSRYLSKAVNKVTLDDILEKTFDYANVSKEDIEFREVLSSTIKAAAPEYNKKSFIKANHYYKKEMSDRISKPNIEKLTNFIEKQPVEKQQFYLDKFITFLRALIVICTQQKQNESTIVMLKFLRDDFRNSLFMDDNPEMIILFQPIVDWITDFFKRDTEEELLKYQNLNARWQKKYGNTLIKLNVAFILISIFSPVAVAYYVTHYQSPPINNNYIIIDSLPSRNKILGRK